MSLRLFIFALLIAGAALADTHEVLSPEDQLRIVQDYLYVTGHRGTPSAAASEELDVSSHPPIKCGMSAVADFVMNRGRIDQRLLASLGVDVLYPRPLGLDQSFATPSDHFLVHYTKTGADAVFQPSRDTDGDGTPDYIEALGVIADSAYLRMIEEMQYPAPPSDGFYPEGVDARFDIYIKNLPSAFFGLSYIDSLNLGGADSLKATSYMVLDNDYTSIPGYANRPYDAIRVTIAHEFFHAVQFGIDYTEAENYDQSFAQRYWMEMSAVWMEEHLYDDINDYYAYLPYFFQAPTKSIQQFDGFTDMHPYGSVVLPIFLSEKYGPEIIRDIWFRCADLGKGPSFLQAAQSSIDSISSHQDNWFSAFRDFALWNYFTGDRASVAPNNLGYSEKANYPIIPDSTQVTGGAWQPTIAVHRSFPTTVNDNDNRIRPDHNAATLMRFERVGLTQRKYMACDSNLNVDTLCVLKYHDSTCRRETEIPLSTIRQFCDPDSSTCRLRGGCSDTVLVRIDSTFDVFGAIDVLAPVWGLSIIMEYWPSSDSGIAADSFLIESALLVSPFPIPPVLFGFGTSTVKPDRFRSMTMILTPATNDYQRYRPGLPMKVAYTSPEAMVMDSQLINRPSAILTPYPNPAVVAEMGGQKLRFRFQVPLDSLSLPPLADPRVVIDIFDLAGQYLKTDDMVSTVSERAGIWESEWDLTNGAGTNVASGVYFGVARLFASAKASTPLVEGKVKVLIVR